MTFKKSTANLSHCKKLPFPVDLKKLQQEFEEQVKLHCQPDISTNPKRSGWKRYHIYRHDDYPDPKLEINFDFNRMTYFSSVLEDNLKGSKLISAMFAIIPPKGIIGLHQDGLGSNSPSLQRRIEDTVRLHIPVYTHEGAKLYIGDQFFKMEEGEFWMLNNYSYHGVLNQDTSKERNHLIFDVIPSPELLQLLRSTTSPVGFQEMPALKFLLRNSNKNKAKKFRNQLPLQQRLKMIFA